MKKLACFLLMWGALLSGCVQMPTERQGIADIRPQISLKFDPRDASAAGARVWLDGLDVGPANDYVDGIRSLRVRTGSHELRVVDGQRVLLDERFYLGDGVNRTFVLR